MHVLRYEKLACSQCTSSNDDLVGREVETPMGRGVIVHADEHCVDVDLAFGTWSGPRSSLGQGSDPILVENQRND